MPYVITTKLQIRAGLDVNRDLVKSRHAVATLEKARFAAADAIRESARGSSGDFITPTTLVTRLPESGGTIILPDGTVIEVGATQWIDLAKTLGAHWWHMAQAAQLGDQKAANSLIAAYNEAQR